MINAGTVYSELVLDTSKYAQGMDQADKAMHDFGEKIVDAGKKAEASFASKMKQMGKDAAKTGKDLMTKVTLPIVGIGAAALKAGAQFEAKMSEVQAISGATGNQLKQLEDKAKEMGATTRFSASQSAEALKYMAMAGWETEAMLGGIEGVMMLAAASGEDLAMVSDIVTDALTAFGMEAGQAIEFADLLASTATSSNTNVGLMGETFKYVAPLFGALGYNAEDAALAIGLMANAGIKGSQAGTTLRGAVTRLTKPSAEAATLINELGISLTDAQGRMLPFSDVMLQLRERFAGLSEQQQAQYAATIFGQEAMSGMLAIMNASEADFNKLTEATTNYSGAAKEMADIMEDNLAGRFTMLMSKIEGTAIKLYDLLLPTVEKAIDRFEKWVDWFDKLDDGTKETIIKIGLLAAAVGPAILVFGTFAGALGNVINIGGKVVSHWGTIAGAAGKLGGFLKPVLGAMFSPWGIAIAAAVAAGYLIIKNWEKIKETAQNLLGSIKNTFNNVKTTITDTWANLRENAYKWATNMMDQFKQGITDKIAAVADVAKGVGGRIKAFLGFSSPTEEGPLSDSDRWMPNFMQMLADGISGNTHRVTVASDGLAQKVGDSLGRVNDYATNTVGIIDKQFKLWVLNNNAVEESTDHLSKQLEVQKQKHEILNKQVKATEVALAQVIEKYGEGSIHALEYENRLLDLKIAQAELKKETDGATGSIENQISAQKRLLDVLDSSTVYYPGSGAIVKTSRKSSPMTDLQKWAWGRLSELQREKFHDGGWVGGARNRKFDEIMALLQDGEFVISKKMIDTIVNAMSGPEVVSIPAPAKEIRTTETGPARGGDINQYITINSPEPLTPSEVARRNLQVSRQLAMEWGF